MGLFKRQATVAEPLQRDEYEKALNRKIEEAERMLTVVESDGWPLVEQLWQEFEDRSQRGFLAGEITAEQHAADIKAIRIIVGGIEAIATAAPDARLKLRELEQHKPAERRRY